MPRLVRYAASLVIALVCGCTQPKCVDDLVWNGERCIAVMDVPHQASDTGVDADAGDPPDPHDDEGEDAGEDGSVPPGDGDAGLDAGEDAATDAGEDSGTDAGCAAGFV